MTHSSKPDSSKSQKSDSDSEKKNNQVEDFGHLSNNPDYIKLLEHFQLAEFTKCSELLEELEKQFPGHPGLASFKDDLQLKLSLKKMSVYTEKEEKRKKKKAMRNLFLFSILSFLIVFIVFYFSYNFFNNSAVKKQQAEEAALIASLDYQAEQLLLDGQTQPAAMVVERIGAINAEYEKLPELISRVDSLLQLDEKYQEALELSKENRNREALELFQEIESEHPGLWDVQHQIETLETSFQVEEFLLEGDKAYDSGSWSEVIDAYENAIYLDPGFNDPLINERLLRSYLNEIISMLENDQTSPEDIENAEEYYRKAVAMTSQSKAFISERENLQIASSDLLKLKYSQVAKDILSDKNQTVASVAEAVSYLRKAANIDPDNTALSSDLNNAEYYQIAFKNFIGMNWDIVIRNLKQIQSADSNYANGNANEMLFNAYYELGKQYSSVGLYLDAISNFEQAENLAWYDTENLLKLFQIQVTMGDTYGKIDDYSNAVSYYEYALNAIQAYSKFQKNPAIANILAEANYLASIGRNEAANTNYLEVLNHIEEIYSTVEFEIDDGVCLAYFASEKLSTVDAIRKANNLPMSMAITLGRKLIIPYFEE